jgi:hypothetical protein
MQERQSNPEDSNDESEDLKSSTCLMIKLLSIRSSLSKHAKIWHNTDPRIPRRKRDHHKLKSHKYTRNTGDFVSATRCGTQTLVPITCRNRALTKDRDIEVGSDVVLVDD